MHSPCRLENLTSLVYGVLLGLELKYWALSQLELWEPLFDTHLVDSYDEIVIYLFGISSKDSFTTNDTNPECLRG